MRVFVTVDAALRAIQIARLAFGEHRQVGVQMAVDAGQSVVATIEMAVAIIYEASLSFLGLGIQPPLPSWGLMLAEARPEIFFSAWMITLPGIALFLLVLFVNLLGDGVRDVFSSSSAAATAALLPPPSSRVKKRISKCS